ncbi:hypothetical protein BMS3Abin17_00625 [archaeon BMS3Abin17]|nr:hypothetical protein BMS3Abin17_00625 [archaeon BMS3Abin17]HDZ60182.1 hypothetical protein [Candidatus Pacearchaeota archaeon]
MKQNKYIPYRTYLNRESYINQMKEQGFKFILKKNKVKLIVGLSCLVVGFVTLPIPTGSIFLIGLGFSLLGISMIDLKQYKEKGIKKLKNKLRGL